MAHSGHVAFTTKTVSGREPQSHDAAIRTCICNVMRNTNQDRRPVMRHCLPSHYEQLLTELSDSHQTHSHFISY